MTEHQVSCATRSKTDNNHENITHLGGSSGGGWRLNVETIITAIDLRTAGFYVIQSRTGLYLAIQVARVPGKFPHLRTRHLGEWTDDLLALPSCVQP